MIGILKSNTLQIGDHVTWEKLAGAGDDITIHEYPSSGIILDITAKHIMLSEDPNYVNFRIIHVCRRDFVKAMNIRIQRKQVSILEAEFVKSYLQYKVVKKSVSTTDINECYFADKNEYITDIVPNEVLKFIDASQRYDYMALYNPRTKQVGDIMIFDRSTRPTGIQFDISKSELDRRLEYVRQYIMR
jgi:hypothetical protein